MEVAMVKENLRILVVDDEQDYCEVLKMILESNGYAVETCLNGKEALDILEDRSFDVVISDLNMPVMDGFELLKNIKEREYDTEGTDTDRIRYYRKGGRDDEERCVFVCYEGERP